MSKYQLIFTFRYETVSSYSFFVKASNYDEALSICAKRMNAYGFHVFDEIGIRKWGK